MNHIYGIEKFGLLAALSLKKSDIFDSAYIVMKFTVLLYISLKTRQCFAQYVNYDDHNRLVMLGNYLRLNPHSIVKEY